MCVFFSFNSDGKGKIYYFDWKIRQQILAKNLKYESADSHTSIADYFGFKGKAEDKLNKWEYNPLTQILRADQINTTDDQAPVYESIKKLDFSQIAPQLIIKPIVYPFKISPPTIGEKHIALLREWASVWASVEDSVWASVEDSVWASVEDSVRDSVGASVRDLVWASVWAYIGSFFNLPDWKYCEKIKVVGYPFQAAVDLWEMGLVSGFDGKIWRLYGGPDGKILWEGSLKAWHLTNGSI